MQIGFILSDTPIPSRWRVKTFHLIGRFDPARIIDILQVDGVEEVEQLGCYRIEVKVARKFKYADVRLDVMSVLEGLGCL